MLNPRVEHPLNDTSTYVSSRTSLGKFVDTSISVHSTTIAGPTTNNQPSYR
jgi:hypothetical protein